MRDTRLAVQDAIGDRFTEAIERILGRRVLGFTSQVLLDQDVAIDFYFLEPAG